MIILKIKYDLDCFVYTYAISTKNLIQELTDRAKDFEILSERISTFCETLNLSLYKYEILSNFDDRVINTEFRISHDFKSILKDDKLLIVQIDILFEKLKLHNRLKSRYFVHEFSIID